MLDSADAADGVGHSARASERDSAYRSDAEPVDSTDSRSHEISSKRSRSHVETEAAELISSGKACSAVPGCAKPTRNSSHRREGARALYSTSTGRVGCALGSQIRGETRSKCPSVRAVQVRAPTLVG